MRFARLVFRVAGVYGLLLLPPQYFLEGKLGRDFPPPVTHPEFYYSFLGVAVVWQLLFLVLSGDPVRYRPMMVVAALEKFSFVVAVFVLYAQGRVPTLVLVFSLVDLLFGVLFLVAYRKTPARPER
ncbi:MAG TPA: hypothetical protein VF591_25505 [Pyrinomonadaceae bacterium]